MSRLFAFAARLFTSASPASRPSPLPSEAAARFDACLAHVLRQEGGFVHHPRDPGGATNLGVTQGVLARWRGVPVSVEEVKALTRDEAAAIYRANYWNRLHGDALPAGVDLVLFDMGVNAGPARAARLLQTAVGTRPDGAIGPATLAAARRAEAAGLVRRLSDARLAYYRSLPTWSDFGRGWSRRTAEVEAAALAMVQGA